MRVHWRLERNDMERAGANFAPGSGTTKLVVRLQRLRDGGGGEPVAEVRIDRAITKDFGEASFSLAPDNARYHAELGISDGAGGWLMLSRSNRLYNSVGIGPSFADAGRTVADEAQPVADSTRSAAYGTGSVADGTKSAAEGPAQAGPRTPIAGGPFPLRWDRNTKPPLSWTAPPVDAPAADAVLDGIPAAPEGDSARGPSPVSEPPRAEAQRAPSQSLPQEPEASATAGVRVLIDAPSQEGVPDVRWGRIGNLTYEDGASRTAGLEIDAELRVHGRAPPNTLIDLFGHPFRVGPGGRFLLVLPLADADLLKQALDLHPPPELRLHRDD